MMADCRNSRSWLYLPVLLLVVVVLSDDRSSVSGSWLKRYIENYHRPHYYHKRHGSDNHDDYNREQIEMENPEPEAKKKDKNKLELPPATEITPGNREGAEKGGGAGDGDGGGTGGGNDGETGGDGGGGGGEGNKGGTGDGNDEDRPKNDKNSFYVEILHRNSVICSGSLISTKKVITSTRCFLPISLDPIKEFLAKDLYVRLSRDIGHLRKSAPHRVSALYFPQDQRHHGIGLHQVALLTLSEAVKGSYVKPVGLCTAKPKEGGKAFLVHLDTKTYSIKRYKTTMVPTEKCKNIYKEGGNDFVKISDVTFCVGNKKNTRQQACNTRVGDPLLVGDKLCGINLYGEHCNEYAGQADNVDVYVDVNEMESFINRF